MARIKNIMFFLIEVIILKITIGYKTWNTKDWIISKDLDERFLICPDCGCCIILKPYNSA